MPFALLLPVVAPDVANVVSLGAARDSYRLLIASLALFGPGLLFFTVHYLMLRGFYALERTRTVFFVQCVIAATNIAVALVVVGATDARFTSPALVIAYTASYAVGSVVSYLMLRRVLGGLRTRVLLRFLVRMAVAAGTSTAAAWLVATLLRGLVDEPGQLAALATGLATLAVDVGGVPRPGPGHAAAGGHRGDGRRAPQVAVPEPVRRLTMGADPRSSPGSEPEGSGVPNTIRPGDVLADRYRLVDLLNESGSGRFWRAHDRVLHRHVAVQVIESGGERATALLDAARASADRPGPAAAAGARRRLHRRGLLRRQRVGLRQLAGRDAGQGRTAGRPPRRLDRLGGRGRDRRGPRPGRGARPAGARERPGRRRRVRAGDRLLRGRRPARRRGRAPNATSPTSARCSTAR